MDRLQTTLENIGQGITVFDQDLRFLAGDTRAFDLLGFPREFFVVGKPLAEFLLQRRAGRVRIGRRR